MARRQLDEINAGSMADIAFLLLVFFLVVTTMKNDQGLPRLLPPPVQDEKPPEFIDRDVYEILVNLNDKLFVEDEEMKISNLREGARNFLLSNGDNVLATLKEDSEMYDETPLRSILYEMPVIKVAISEIEEKIAEWEKKQELILNASELNLEALTGAEDKLKDLGKALEKQQAIQYALEYFPGFASLPGSAMISVQNDNSSTYETYVAVNNELEGALNDLRNEVCLNKFGVLYDDLDVEDEDDKKKILAVRQLYPQRISEAEPLDIGGYSK